MASYEERTDGYTAVEEDYAGYTVRDRNGEKIGKVDDLFLDENDRPEYFGVKMGFLGSKSTLIPADVANIDRERGFVEVTQPKSTVKEGPAFDDDQEITPEYEREVREFYGLSVPQDSGDRASYGSYSSGAGYESTGTASSATGNDRGSSAEQSGNVGPGMAMGDREGDEFVEHAGDNEGVRQQGSDLEDEDELKVQRSEEELRTGTREREAGSVNVRKRVRTERETQTVPTRHEEVTVDRVPASGEASETDIGEQDVSMPVTEDEVVTEKKAVKKEEIRVSKEAVEGSETVEEDLRKEEVEVDDATGRGSNR